MSAYILSNALVYLKDILPITAGVWATFRISPDLERGLDINTWGVNAFFVLKSSTQIERYLITAVWGVATIVKRGLEQDGITENANLKKSWGDGSVGYISVKPDDFIATGKLDTAGGLRNTMGTAQNIWATNGSPNITVADTTGWANGATITGTGIPGGTTIVSFVPNTSAVLSNNFTGTTGTVSVVVWKRMALEIDSNNNEVKKVITPWTTFNPTDTIRKTNSLWVYEDVAFSQLQASLSPSAIIDQQYIAWQSFSLWDSVFAEWYSTFANATTAVNISDVTANTRIFLPIFWNGVSMSTLKLALRKVGTPTQNINFRIETDNGSWLPSWTLFHANGTASITQWSLTTSFVDTTITLGWSITIPAGQLCHIVMYQWTYWTETINNTNYYQVWISSNHSNSRYAGWHNGTSYSRKWANSTGTLTGDAYSQTIASITTTFTALKPFYLTQVNLSAFGTAIQPTVTVAQTTRGSMAVLASSYIASFSTPFLIYPWTFTINLNYGSAVNVRYATAYSPASPLFTSTPNQTFSITWVIGQEEMTIPYVSSSGILSTVISKTSAYLSYKLESYPSFTTDAITKWNVTTRAILWEIWVPGVIDNTLYYISDIDWWISTTAGTNSSKAWKWFWANLFIDKYAS